MICCFENINGDGTQPISCITPYCLDLFENISDNLSIFKYLLGIIHGQDIRIEIIKDEVKIITPAQIHSFNHIIHIEETFLSYLWIFCYCSISDFDELIQKPSLGHITNVKQVALVRDYINYADSLSQRFSIWNIDKYPNPVKYIKEESNYIEVATLHFEFAFLFVLLHEISHYLIGHIVPFKEVEGGQMIQDEYDADALAFKLLITSDQYPDQLIHKKDGAILGLCSLLFLSNPKIESTHPNPVKRIRRILEEFTPFENEYAWGIAAMCIQHWNDLRNYHNINIPQQINSYKDYFNHVAKLFEN